MKVAARRVSLALMHARDERGEMTLVGLSEVREQWQLRKRPVVKRFRGAGQSAKGEMAVTMQDSANSSHLAQRDQVNERTNGHQLLV